MGKKKPWWKSWENWTRFFAIVAILWSGYDWWWTHLRVSSELRLSFIETHFSGSGADRHLAVEFALANTGTTPAILAEVCMLPKPWGEESGNPNDYSADGRGSGVVIPSSTGTAWLDSPSGERQSAISIPAGDLVKHKAYFDVSSYAEREWYEDSDNWVDLSLYTTVVDFEGNLHGSELAQTAEISGPSRHRLSYSGPQKILPGEYSNVRQTGLNVGIGNTCSFVWSVYKPKVDN